MKYRFSTAALLCAALSAASAQVASHAPTAMHSMTGTTSAASKAEVSGASLQVTGKPVVRILEIYEPRSLSDKALLLECLQHEQEACDLYVNLLPLVQDHPGLKKVIAGLAREESGHMAGIRRLAGKL